MSQSTKILVPCFVTVVGCLIALSSGVFAIAGAPDSITIGAWLVGAVVAAFACWAIPTDLETLRS